MWRPFLAAWHQVSHQPNRASLDAGPQRAATPAEASDPRRADADGLFNLMDICRAIDYKAILRPKGTGIVWASYWQNREASMKTSRVLFVVLLGLAATTAWAEGGESLAVSRSGNPVSIDLRWLQRHVAKAADGFGQRSVKASCLA